MNNNLDNLMTYQCMGCTNGIKMCYNRPCWGTPNEFRRIIDAGFASKLMIDFWHGGEAQIPGVGKNPFNHNVFFLCGALAGKEGDIVGLNPTGKCSLLNEKDQCSIHDIKPIQGRTSCCKHPDAYDERIDILRLWDTEEGKSLIEEWKIMVKLNKPTEVPEITLSSAFEMLTSIIDKYKK